MATQIQSKVFRSTVDGKSYDVSAVVDDVWTQANYFLATLPVNDVVDIKTELMPTHGAYGNKSGCHYQIIVIYLKH